MLCRKLYLIHAHAYFPYTCEAERQEADSFRSAFATEFQDDSSVLVSAIVPKPAGPHPTPQFEMAFTVPKLAEVVPWLMFNRPGSFSVLVHPFTDKLVDDHTCRAVWIGKQLECHLETLANIEKRMATDIAGGKDEAAILWQVMEP